MLLPNSGVTWTRYRRKTAIPPLTALHRGWSVHAKLCQTIRRLQYRRPSIYMTIDPRLPSLSPNQHVPLRECRCVVHTFHLQVSLIEKTLIVTTMFQQPLKRQNEQSPRLADDSAPLFTFGDGFIGTIILLVAAVRPLFFFSTGLSRCTIILLRPAPLVEAMTKLAPTRCHQKQREKKRPQLNHESKMGPNAGTPLASKSYTNLDVTGPFEMTHTHSAPLALYSL